MKLSSYNLSSRRVKQLLMFLDSFSGRKIPITPGGFGLVIGDWEKTCSR
jgi:hypothetical protein